MATTLPESFLSRMAALLPADEMTALHAALTAAAPTSIRINRAKATAAEEDALRREGRPVPWCAEGVILPKRPAFTTDPLLHAGVYYVQEAASMFLAHVLRSIVGRSPIACLDLCAAPGGKTTAALSVLPPGSVMVSNEVDRRRARILAENVQKWGRAAIVTASSPAELGRLRDAFDVLIVDAPCSGEGMMRKDEEAIADWSVAKVAHCAALQREILSAVWPALRPGGMVVYSTCTFNVEENEHTVDYICDELGADAMAVPVAAEWGIGGPIAGCRPACRFMPYRTVGEGLFMAVARKRDDAPCRHRRDVRPLKSQRPSRATGVAGGKLDMRQAMSETSAWLANGLDLSMNATADGRLRAMTPAMAALAHQMVACGIYILHGGIEVAAMKGRDLIPAHGLALSTALAHDAFPRVELAHDEALAYLRREAIVLPADTPAGFVLPCYQGHPLGFVKNLGSRSNNLYPAEWRIRHL